MKIIIKVFILLSIVVLGSLRKIKKNRRNRKNVSRYYSDDDSYIRDHYKDEGPCSYFCSRIIEDYNYKYKENAKIEDLREIDQKEEEELKCLVKVKGDEIDLYYSFIDDKTFRFDSIKVTDTPEGKKKRWCNRIGGQGTH